MNKVFVFHFPNLRPNVLQELLENWSFLAEYAPVICRIDLTYLPLDNRETALANISDSLGRIRERITKSIPGITVKNHIIEGNDAKLFVQSQNAQIKIEVNTTTRGHLHPMKLLQVNDKVQERFKKLT